MGASAVKKKRILTRVLGLMAGLGLSAVAQSGLITDIVSVDAPVPGAASWTHTLEGFTPGSAVSGSLSIAIFDDMTACELPGLFGGCLDWDLETAIIVVDLIDLQDGGMHLVSLGNWSGSLADSRHPVSPTYMSWALRAAPRSRKTTWCHTRKLPGQQVRSQRPSRPGLAAKRLGTRPALRRRRSAMSAATSAVQPVWCEAPRPSPVSPWKYSWKRIASRDRKSVV